MRNAFMQVARVKMHTERYREVLWVHKYSGVTMVRDVMMIASSYTVFGLITTYLSAQVPMMQWSRTETIFGTALFILGEGINHYHHLVLADLRTDASIKSYKVGEILAFVAMTLVAQHVLVLPFQIGSALYLMMRAYSTKEWYEQRFPSAPRKACLVPYVF
ncbi:hypothetical protein EC973_001522 [Apophysomyces ossiformis]|uniref:3-oxo-5-alpha-steroid 4-dehydrogenase C-terminal domain-containing protein n=1 Tax=Apophysomyces ossiformis TaxID=679940 RepID=A0A8H7BLV6_9FUNG|nr:hypothetical protein EC973_001522 [Apophysomyces ossiformis]